MPYSHLNDFPADIRARAAGVRLLGLDVDGTLTDGSLVYDAHGNELKTFSVLDGMGIKLLHGIGVQVALVTQRDSAMVTRRAEDLGIAHVHQGVHDKRSAFDALARSLSLSLSQCAFMGDDLNDLPVLTAVGFAAAPPNAHPWVRERVHWRTTLRGGFGAVRELCDLIIAAQGQAETVLAKYLPTA